MDMLCSCRELLSISCHSCVFVGHGGTEVRKLPVDASNELELTRGVLVFIFADLGREPVDHVYCSDVSGFGYALHESPLSTADLWEVAGHRERWCFRPR